MIYGAKNIMVAPFAAADAEPAGALPKYAAAVRLGELNKVADAPVFNEARASADNRTARVVSRFKECAVDVAILEMENTVASAVLGATIEGGTKKNLHFKDSDKAPYCGIAFYVNHAMDGNVDKFKGIFYPKAKAVIQGQAYDTNGESITLQAQNLKFIAVAANSGDWKIESEYMGSEAEAAAWVDEMLASA